MSDPLTRELSRREVAAAGLCIAAAVAPHASHLGLRLTSFFFAVIALRLLVGRRGPLASRAVVGLASLAGLILVALDHPALFSRDGGVALLSVMLGLKVVEMRTRRDLLVLAFLGYFVVITQFLYTRDMGIAGYLGAVVVALTALLVHAGRARGELRPLGDLRVAGVLLVQALPLMAVLFVLFPRLDGPLWTLGSDEQRGVTGLSGKLSPGSVSRVARSDEIAFRVTFQGETPPPEARYFRGPVLWLTDGVTWSTAEVPGAPPDPGRAEGSRVVQQVTMEPNGEPWLLALDLPVTAPPGAVLTPDGQVRRRQPLRERTSYRIESVAGPAPVGDLWLSQRALALQLPDRAGPRMRRLADSWREGGAAPAQIVERALAHFNTEPFVYTLQPGALGTDPLDEFLFETRRGFCEHYAAAFTLLMRLAGVPARAVTGYQGGELNPRGGYLMVRQADAHAWSEVWLEGSGWMRVDPTAAVSPERVERSIDPAGSVREGEVRFDGERGLLGGLMRQLSWGLDALDLGWHRWVVGYTRDSQGRLLESLGLGFLQGQRLALGAVVFALGVLAAIALLLTRNERRPADPVQAAWAKACTKLAGAGIVRAPEEGPWDLSGRVARTRPDLARSVHAIAALYIAQRYGREKGPEQLRRLRTLVRELRP